MSVLKYHCEEFGVKLEIEETIIEKMILESRAHYPKEFGGILIGRYSDDLNTAIITDIIIPTEYDNSRSHFVRGSEGIEERLKAEFNKNPSIIYLGEWHTHPNSSPNPSRADISTLIQLSNSCSVLIKNPVMMIIGLTTKDFECAFYVINDKSLYRYG